MTCRFVVRIAAVLLLAVAALLAIGALFAAREQQLPTISGGGGGGDDETETETKTERRTETPAAAAAATTTRQSLAPYQQNPTEDHKKNQRRELRCKIDFFWIQNPESRYSVCVFWIC